MSTTQTSNAPQSPAATPADRRKLVFFVGNDPDVDPGPLRTAQHFASVAAEAGIAAELRLAARSVRNIADVPAQPEGVFVTICPRAMEKYGVTGAQLDGIGARPRRLAEIFAEVAEGTSVLIPVTHTIDDPTQA